MFKKMCYTSYSEIGKRLGGNILRVVFSFHGKGVDDEERDAVGSVPYGGERDGALSAGRGTHSLRGGGVNLRKEVDVQVQ